MRLLERRQCQLRLGDHRAVDRVRHLDAAEPLGKGDDAERQRHRAEDLQPALRLARRRLPQPDDLGRAAADVEDDRVGDARVEQRGAAGDDEARLLGGRDDLEVDADRLAHPVDEAGAIRRLAAGLGRDIAA